MPSITQAIIDYVKEHPGSQTQEIFDGVLSANKLGTVQNTLSRLDRSGVLQNRGGRKNRWHPARWYFVEPNASDYSRKLAKDILDMLASVPQPIREDVLAEKLDELFEAQA